MMNPPDPAVAGCESPFRSLKTFILLDEAIHAAALVAAQELIRVVKIYHDEKKHGPLVGAKMLLWPVG
jgi:hypothetical protein